MYVVAGFESPVRGLAFVVGFKCASAVVQFVIRGTVMSVLVA